MSKDYETKHVGGSSTQHVEFDASNYVSNVNAKIVNPLGGFSKAELKAQVNDFCSEFGFDGKQDTFYKGALIAQSPTQFEELPELTEDDKYHLRREVTHKWHLPKALYYSIAVCSLGSAIQGWDNTGANGANLSFPVEFGIEHNSWLVGVINSAPTLFGFASAWSADPINNWLGRRGTIFLTGLFCVFPVLGQAFARNWWELLICRAIMGIGMGVKISTIPAYTAEVSPANIRGGLSTSFQLWVAFGILVGFSSNLCFYRIGRLAWRFQLAAAFAPAIPILIFIWFCPESPRWLMKKGRINKAYTAFCRIRNSEMQAARDLYYAYAQFREEREAFAGKTFFDRLTDLVRVPRLRRAAVCSAWVVISQQFSGINIMAFYSSTIFSEAGYSTLNTLLASWGWGLVTFLAAFPAIWLMDTFGRRNMLLFTFPNMAWCLLAAGLCFLMAVENSARVPLIAFFIYLFSAFYGPGIGPMASIYFSESFPVSHREIGGAVTVSINNAVGSALGLTFPSLLAKVGPTGAFGFYAGLNLIAFIVIFFLIRETKQRTLEELDYIFGVPTGRHAAYQLRTYLPWFFKRYVLFQKKAELKPLYHVEHQHLHNRGSEVSSGMDTP